MEYQLIIDDYIGYWGVSKTNVRNTLAKYKGKHVDVRISSFGGDLSHALDIRQQFIDHGDVTAHIVGPSASSATVIATGAKRVCMSRYATYLVHKCSNCIDVWGSYNADQIQQLIDSLIENKLENDKFDVVLASIYAEKTGRSVEELLDVLKAGSWLSAQEALDYGFVDELVEYTGEKRNFFSPELAGKLNALGLPSIGLPRRENAGEQAEKPKSNKQNQKMKHNFKKVEELLKLDTIVPDADGYVSVTEDEFQKINDRVDELETSNSSMKTDIASKDARIAELEAQVENLRKAPGDDTSDIEDDAKDEPAKFNAVEMYNNLKSMI